MENRSNKINLAAIEKTFKNRIPGPQGVTDKFAVMALITEKSGVPCFIYEKRALTLNRQPGEICFPGGRMEPGESPLNAAVRETCEELGISEKNIRVLGQADFVLTFYNTQIFPFVGVLEGVKTEDIVVSPAEVDKIFTVPLDLFAQKPERRSQLTFSMAFPPDFPFELIPRGKEYRWGKPREYSELFYEFGGEIIWGLTARISMDIYKTVIREIYGTI